MADDVPQVSIDVAQLKQIGQYHLPNLASVHLDAANALDAVEYLRPQLFLTPASGESGVKSVIYPKWLELYSVLQSIMQHTVENLTATGDGCAAAADAFYDQDLSNSEKLAVDGEMDSFWTGDDGEPGHTKPPHPEAPPKPNPIPGEDELYTADDGAGPDEADLVDLD